MKKLFLAWQDSQSRRWFPIGKLTFDGKNYHFAYIHGVTKAQSESNFKLLHSFPKCDRVYTSSELFPLFSNRLMRPSRPDYQDYIQWLNIPQNEDEPMTILARSGGRKATDTFELFPCPESNKDGVYQIHFFVHGLRYLPPDSIERIKHLKPKERLYLTRDFQNPYDDKALLLRTEERHSIGYCPRYLAADLVEVLQQKPASSGRRTGSMHRPLRTAQSVCACVERVNPAPTPIQLRLLCNMTIEGNNNFAPFNSQDYQSIVNTSYPLTDVA
ncbi:MAG: hypothetical protein RLZZ381_79 [Cyanobacteriota bacterium]|jgi:hypothetical protein